MQLMQNITTVLAHRTNCSDLGDPISGIVPKMPPAENLTPQAAVDYLNADPNNALVILSMDWKSSDDGLEYRPRCLLAENLKAAVFRCSSFGQTRHLPACGNDFGYSISSAGFYFADGGDLNAEEALNDAIDVLLI